MEDLWQPLVDPPFVARVRALVAAQVAPSADRIDREDVFPYEAIGALAAAGMTAISIAPAHGGAGQGLAHNAALFEEVGVASAAVATSLMTMLQAQTLLRLYGTDDQRSRWLPRLAAGLVASFALTEPAQGSDIRSPATRAERRGGRWVLDGHKTLVSSGSAAELFMVLAQTDEGPAVFAVPRDAPGLSCEMSEDSAAFGLRNGGSVELMLRGAELPEEALVGSPGRGVRQVATTLDETRVMAAALCVGVGRAAFDGALAYAQERIVYGQPVADHQGIRWYLADMLASLDAARSLVYRAARAGDEAGHESNDLARLSSEAKLIASRTAFEVASQAVQICGAHGVREKSPFGRYLRDAKAYQIGGGTSEVLRETIARRLAPRRP